MSLVEIFEELKDFRVDRNKRQLTGYDNIISLGMMMGLSHHKFYSLASQRL